MEVQALTGGLGARVEGIDLRDIDRVRETLPPLLQEHGLLIVSGQPLSQEEVNALASGFGDTTPHPSTAGFKLAKKPPTNIKHGGDERPPPDTGFHSDYSFSEVVAEVGILHGVVMPSKGGDTVWTDMQLAFETLSPALQAFLATLTARHGFTDEQIQEMREQFGDDFIDLQPETFRGTVHPVVISHPVTRRPLLFVAPGYTREIVELTRYESDALLRLLYAHIKQPRLHYRHHWRVNDVGIWDELRTAHEAPTDFWPELRVLRRATAGLVRPAPARL